MSAGFQIPGTFWQYYEIAELAGSLCISGNFLGVSANNGADFMHHNDVDLDFYLVRSVIGSNVINLSNVFGRHVYVQVQYHRSQFHFCTRSNNRRKRRDCSESEVHIDEGEEKRSGKSIKLQK